MPSSKLHLKETPDERRERDLHRARKAARKRRRQATPEESNDHEAGPSSSKRHRADYLDPIYRTFFSADGLNGSRPPSPQTQFRRMQAAFDESFQERMFAAMEDDERLDTLESRFNDYAHVPRRWRGGGMDRMDDELGMDPNVMEDEAYAEWVREGMWRCVPLYSQCHLQA